MRIYIFGPMRGRPEFNFPAFHDAARYLRKWGHTVISPAEMDIEQDGFDPVTGDNKLSQRGYAERDASAIIGINGQQGVDGLYGLRGWPESNGGVAEAAIGHWIGAKFLLQDPNETRAILNIKGESF